MAKTTQCYSQYWDGTQKNPSLTEWYPKGGNFALAPALVSLGEGYLDFLGVDNDGELKLQVYAGNNWQPSTTEWYSLRDLVNHFRCLHVLEKGIPPRLAR